ncbi:hypothetical protein BGZ74_004685, partial [Mortierella antarctica]
ATVIMFPADMDAPAPDAVFRPQRSTPDAQLFLPNVKDVARFRDICQSHFADAVLRSLPKHSSNRGIPIEPVE